MIRRLFWSLFVVVLACSAGGAAEVRRVVTGIDQNNKAVVLFDSSLALKPGGSGNPAANVWITDSVPPGFSFTADTVTRPLVRCHQPSKPSLAKIRDRKLWVEASEPVASGPSHS